MYSILTDQEIITLFSSLGNTEKNFLQKVVRAIPDVLYVMNLETRVILYSSRLVALEIGYSAKEVDAMDNPIIDIMHPDDKPRFINHLEEVKATGNQQVVSIEYRLIRHDGKIAWYNDRNTVFTRTVKGVPHTKIGIAHEITERKQYQERLLANAKIIEQSEALAATGSWEYDVSSKDFTWSPGMYKLFNVPNNYPIQPRIYLDYSIEKDLPVAQRIVQAIEDGQNDFEETLHINSNGGIRSVRIKAEPLQRSNGKYDKIIGTDLDTTIIEKKQIELEKLNDQLRRMNREVVNLHADLKTFSQVMAAQYETNLKNIYTSFEMIVRHDADNLTNNSKAIIRKIQGSIQRMNLLTSDIEAYLNLSLHETDKEHVDLDDILSTIIADLKERIANQDITINKEEIGSIVGSPNLINILFHKLLDNAIKFRSNDMKAIINISSVVNDLSAAKVLAVSIEDNGIGVDPSEKENVFDLFFKNHYNRKLKGSGVGLAIAKKIMELHNGYIGVEPKAVEQGTVVTCYFPLPD
jgi:PAS domain S-box-containing protein